MSSNLLARETSPYLLQHKDNPVHWMPWGPDALALAQSLDRPILLSVGYAACHWCHVMAHESFENPEIAALMNERFVNIKVDREERPDIDKIYMDALHRLGEQGGWPLTMFLTPQGEPFWGGTYFPPESGYGRPGFPHVLTEISRIYHTEPDKVRHNSEALAAALRAPPRSQPAPLSLDLLDQAASQIVDITDPIQGGLRGAPKFPQVPLFSLLWRAYLRRGEDRFRDSVVTTLTHMGQGGIYDHLAGGFSRYSVDAAWLVPHFEKMLYDNAQILDLMILVWQDTGNDLFRTRIEETVTWLLSEMIAPSGGFAASLDADSEGVEGKFYVWSRAEIEAILPPEMSALFCSVYDVTERGNWDGHTILNRLNHPALLDDARESQLRDARSVLLKAREGRIRPGWDDKVLADWNGLMIATLAEAGAAFENPSWIQAARDAFDVILTQMRIEGRLRHSLREGHARHTAIADDYANLIKAALSLYEATGEDRFIADAEDLIEPFNTYYWDVRDGGYFYTASDAEALITRQKLSLDDATPNANATMVGNLARLALATGHTEHTRRAEAILATFSGDAVGNIFSHAGMLNGFEDLVALTQVIIVASDFDEASSLRRAVLAQSIPSRMILTLKTTSQLGRDHPAAGKTMVDGRPTLYLCRGTTCSLPVTETEEVAALIKRPHS
ncbi:hypothetical protein FHS85_000197 [Rhodoligotrophos appendicifer]|uniref:thioredoxin domain-containing protein n=1 Tax=Rhodoligotrophos appendicifer TaxID=987056 RepID=UPI00117D9642|nr:thioredoxin domain-containing protein [Rhodoligotrophos appendicifer]